MAYVDFGPSGTSGRATFSGVGVAQMRSERGLVGSPVNTTVPTSVHGNDDDNLPRKHFGVTLAGISTLYPGSSNPLRVTFSNPLTFDIVVSRVSVSAIGAPGCGKRHLVTGSYVLPRPLTVPPNGPTKTRKVPFGMRTSAPDACQGKTFTVTVSAKAVKK